MRYPVDVHLKCRLMILVPRKCHRYASLVLKRGIPVDSGSSSRWVSNEVPCGCAPEMSFDGFSTPKMS